MLQPTSVDICGRVPWLRTWEVGSRTHTGRAKDLRRTKGEIWVRERSVPSWKINQQ